MESFQPPPLKRLSPGHRVVLDCAAAVLAMVLCTLAWQGTAHVGGPTAADGVTAALAVLAVAFRRRRPRALLAPVVIVGAAATFARGGPVPLVAVAFVMYTVPQRFPRRASLQVLTATLLVMVPAAGLTGFLHLPYGPPAQHSAALLVEGALLVTVAWTIGYAVQQQRLYTAGLRARAEERAQARVAETKRALVEERLRIARELHDVVAHSMSVIAVQAGVANHVAAERPEEARRVLSSIEETSRTALREMRALLGVLRREDERSESSSPAPGLADLEALVERAAEAGVRVELRITGDRPGLSAGLDLAAYRIVQEALTNVIKHAATGHCRVSVDYVPDGLAVEVVDDGRGAADPGSGHGLVGMRERVAVYGGEFTAGPLPGRGFRVAARFPLTAGVAA
ncbi:sensor histidine kinase [Kitasatospora sp. NPDC018058]|uniref:sensor histidine kinase n=1 Tax=Kitasatospora sp. NPDC018058 TaxID=3364025 RepID=UPI0037C1173C